MQGRMQSSEKKKKVSEVENDPREGERDKVLERKQSNGGAPRKIAYKVHDIGQDAVFDKQSSDIKNLHALKPHPRHLPDNIPAKDPIHAMVKRHKKQLPPMQDESDHETSQKRTEKLPPLVQDKYGKLPALNNEKYYENSPSPNKKKLKELSKVYKMSLGNTDDVTEKYSVAARKERIHNRSKNYGAHAGNAAEYASNLVKYGKGYDDDF